MKLPTSQQEIAMAKYGDIVALLEWASRANRSTKTPKTSRRKGFDKSNIEDLDLAEVYLKLDAREKRIKASKEAIEKMMKKEDKKDEKKKEFLSVPQLTMLLVASFPITAPLYVFWISNALRAAGWK